MHVQPLVGADQPVDRGDVDDLAVPLLQHQPCRQLAALEHAGDIHVEDALPIGARRIHARSDHTDPGVVDQDVEAAKSIAAWPGSSARPPPDRRCRSASASASRPASGSALPICSARSPFTSGTTRLAPACGQGERHVAAEPAAAAGDQRRLAAEVEQLVHLHALRGYVCAGQGAARIVDHDLLEVRFAQAELVEVLLQLSGEKRIARATIRRQVGPIAHVVRQHQVADEARVEDVAHHAEVLLPVVRVGGAHAIERDEGAAPRNLGVVLEHRIALRMADHDTARIDALFAQDVQLVEAMRSTRGVQGDGQTRCACGPGRPRAARAPRRPRSRSRARQSRR